MITVLSPAKNLDLKESPVTEIRTQPVFIHEAEILAGILKKKSPAQLAKLMKINPKLAGLNYERYSKWSSHSQPENSQQAFLTFKGDVYRGLDTATLSEEDFQFAQSHLRILSGLYGILRPLDLVQPYRLEMGTAIKNPAGKDLYSFWREKVTRNLTGTIKESGSKVLVNLASKEYFKAIDHDTLNARVITPDFRESHGDSYRPVHIFLKRARGLMARFIIKNRTTDPDQIKLFDTEGYFYSENLSTELRWVFTR